MRCAPVLLVVLLVACGQQPAENPADTLTADPVRLKALRAKCAADSAGRGRSRLPGCCRSLRRRFFAGHAGPDEFQSLADLPPIPASFDEPVGEDMP